MSTAVGEPVSGIWEELPTSRIVFFFDSRSNAGRRIDELARRAEAAYQRGWAWFFDSGDRPTIAAYLVDWFAEADPPGWIGADRRAIWLPISPEQPSAGLERALLRLLASASTGLD